MSDETTEAMTFDEAIGKLTIQFESVANFGEIEEAQGLEYLSTIRAHVAELERENAELRKQLKNEEDYRSGTMGDE